MGTITFSDAAPADLENTRFSFAQGEFSLNSGGSFDTEDNGLLQAALAHPWLSVKIEVPAPAPVSEADQNDPHNNPAIDHLSLAATDEAKEAAAAADAAIQKANAAAETAPEVVVADAPAETVEGEQAPAPSPDAQALPAPGVTITQVGA